MVVIKALPALFLLIAHCASSPAELESTGGSVAPVVSLTSGNFLGQTSAINRTDRWLGIPYAEPPVGSLRFKAPVAITKPSQSVQSATEFGNACPQVPSNSLGAPQNEDCLFLNVWRPVGTTAKDRLPVLVWFHVSLLERHRSNGLRIYLFREDHS